MTFYKPSLAVVVLLATAVCSCHVREKPVSDQEALALAKQIEGSVQRQDTTFLNDLIDSKKFASRILIDAHAPFDIALAELARQQLANFRLGAVVIGSTREGGMYNLLRRYNKGGHQHLLFRLVASNGGFTYHDFELIKDGKEVKAIDLFDYGTGKSVSQLIGEPLIAARVKRSDMTEDQRADADLMKSAKEYLEGANPEEAYSFYQQASEKARKREDFQRLHIQIAIKLSDSAYLAALNEYKANFPQSESIYMSLFGAYLGAKDYPAALDALNKFDSFIPDDPFLDFYRALIYSFMDNHAQAQVALSRVHRYMPRFGGAVVPMIENDVKFGHPDSAAMLVKEAEDLNNITPEQLEAIEKVYPTIKPYLK